ncbi:MAG TPA: hypothetical protein VIL31_01400 [Cyclobacteriaceae bacterium]|jgi:hypothetical protein
MSNARSPWWPLVITTLPAAILLYINWEAVGLIADQLPARLHVEWVLTGAVLVIIWLTHTGYSIRYLWHYRKLDRSYALFTIWSYTLALLVYSRAGCENIPDAFQYTVLGDQRLWYVIVCLAPTFVHAAMIMRGPRWRLLLQKSVILPIATIVMIAVTHPRWSDVMMITLIAVVPLISVQWVRSLVIQKPEWQPYIYIAVRLTAALAYPLTGVLTNDDIFLDIALQSWYHKGFYLLAIVNAIAMCIPEPRHRYARMVLFILRLTTSGFMLFMITIYLPILPQSAMALASFGFGYLMLAPVVLSVAKASILGADIAFLKLHFSRQRLILIALVATILCTALTVYILHPSTFDVLIALYRYASSRNG